MQYDEAVVNQLQKLEQLRIASRSSAAVN